MWLHWSLWQRKACSLVAASEGYSSGARTSHSSGFFCCRAQAVVHVGSVVTSHRLSCLAARGVVLDQGSNLCPLVGQADS